MTDDYERENGNQQGNTTSPEDLSVIRKPNGGYYEKSFMLDLKKKMGARLVPGDINSVGAIWSDEGIDMSSFLENEDNYDKALTEAMNLIKPLAQSQGRRRTRDRAHCDFLELSKEEQALITAKGAEAANKAAKKAKLAVQVRPVPPGHLLFDQDETNYGVFATGQIKNNMVLGQYNDKKVLFKSEVDARYEGREEQR